MAELIVAIFSTIVQNSCMPYFVDLLIRTLHHPYWDNGYRKSPYIVSF